MIIKRDGILQHYGTPRHSGRYPWGSGKEPFQRTPDFRATVLQLKKDGVSEKEIADGFGLSIKDLRNQITLDKAAYRASLITQAQNLSDKGYSPTEIGRIMGKNESSIRSLLDPAVQERANMLQATSNMLRDQMSKKLYLDVGIGTELEVGVKRTLLDAAISDLTTNGGYKIQYIKETQLGTGKETIFKVLTKDDVPYSELVKNKAQIQTITDWSEDDGRTFQQLQPVKSVDSNRILVKFKEDGGDERDGTIQIRPGVEDLSLGDKRYVQTRVEVDGTHFLKGVAIYNYNKDDFPEGVDIIYNSSKSKEVGKMGAMKVNDGDDPTNPFGSSIRQVMYTDKDGNEQLSPLNRVGYNNKGGEEGDWDAWGTSKTLATQFLAKQRVDVAEEQLKLIYDIKKDQYEDALKITNPAVKQMMLDSIADDCDSASVHMKAQAFAGQATKLLLPVPSLKDGECYDPTLPDGAKIASWRYPHQGTYEIATLTNNLKNKEAQSFMKNATDAIGVNKKAAEIQSGADWDGDTVTRVRIDTTSNASKIVAMDQLKELKNFDAKTRFKGYDGMKVMTEREKGIWMGKATNLNQDATQKGGTYSELARCSMFAQTVIDSVKHKLNWKEAYNSLGIAELQEKYQGKKGGGASTLFTRATSEIRVDAKRPLRKGDTGYEDPVTGERFVARRGEYSIDLKTGKKVAVSVDARKPFVNKDGELVEPGVRQVKTTKLGEYRDPYKLLSSNPTPMELVYAKHSKSLIDLADTARLESSKLGRTKYSPSAKATYSQEVDSINAKVKLNKLNAPRERAVVLLSNAVVRAKQQANPEMTPEQLKKVKNSALDTARVRLNSKKTPVMLSKKEWEAIEAGAVSHNVLLDVIKGMPKQHLIEMATPRSSTGPSPAKLARAKTYLNNGYNLSEIAEMTGLSTSTIASLK